MRFELDVPALQALTAGFATARLRAVPLHADQAPSLWRWMTDPRVYEWIGIRPPPDEAELVGRLSRWGTRSELPERELDLAWTVQRLSDGASVGCLDASVAHGRRVASNVGYFFDPAVWGQGLCAEAVGGLCALLDAHGITEQHATVTLGNHASGRLLQRLGFVRTRLIPGADTLRGVLVDDVAYQRGPAQAAR